MKRVILSSLLVGSVLLASEVPSLAEFEAEYTQKELNLLANAIESDIVGLIKEGRRAIVYTREQLALADKEAPQVVASVPATGIQCHIMAVTEDNVTRYKYTSVYHREGVNLCEVPTLNKRAEYYLLVEGKGEQSVAGNIFVYTRGDTLVDERGL